MPLKFHWLTLGKLQNYLQAVLELSGRIHYYVQLEQRVRYSTMYLTYVYDKQRKFIKSYRNKSPAYREHLELT